MVQEIVELRRLGFRFIFLSDDNFYPVTLRDLELARRRGDPALFDQLQSIRQSRFKVVHRRECQMNHMAVVLAMV